MYLTILSSFSLLYSQGRVEMKEALLQSKLYIIRIINIP